MKMNRTHSSESLDDGLNDIISSGSSSPANFTSDDEVDVYNGLFPGISGQSSGIKSNTTINHNLVKKVEPYQDGGSDQFSSRLQQAIHRAGSLRPLSNNHYLSEDNGQLVSGPSTSSYHDRPTSSNVGIDLHPSHIPDVVPKLGSIWNDSLKFATPPGSHRSENYSDYENDGNIFGRREQSMMEPSPIHIMASSTRNLESIATTMCDRLVSCRSLADAIELVDSERDVIEDVTRILLEAPAFRDYDMSNYQIDYSVKESFNPNFWLDREPVLTTADGNCQYHAISISLTGSECYTQEVRLATAVAVLDNRDWFDAMLKLIDKGTVLDLVHTISRSYSWGDETTLKAVAVAIKRRIFLYTCNMGKKDYEMVKTLSKEELLDAFKEKKYRGGTGIHTYADPLNHVSPNNYIMLFHKSEHFIAVLPTSQQPTMFAPYNPIVPTFS